MRIYEGSPRQDWEEVLRSVGAHIDERGMRGIVFIETENGFVVQGTVVATGPGSAWGESMGTARVETLTLDDDEVAKFMEDAVGHRGAAPEATPKRFESELRVIGRYFDEQKPRDLFFFELDGSYIARLTRSGQGGLKQELVEFTQADVADLIAKAPALRRPTNPAKPG